jgi:hypothetical protein
MNFSLRLLEKLLFKKIELWVLGLVLLFSFVAAVMFGATVRHTMMGNRLLGPVGEFALRIATIPGDIRRLTTDPTQINPMLTSGQERFSGLSGWTPTQMEIKSKSDLGLLLLSRYDGELKSSVVELIDLNKKEILHQWMYSSDYVVRREKSNRFLHPLLTRDGTLISIVGRGLILASDVCNNLAWHTDLERPSFHHSIEKDAEGYLWVPSRMYPQTFPGAGEGFNDDTITKLSSDGEVLLRRSVSQILIDNGYRYLIYGMDSFEEDPIHLNDIQPVNNDGPFWKKGDLFLSLRHQSMIMLYRPSTNEMIWNQQGPWNMQHDVDILNDHQISVFDNNTNKTAKGDKVMGHNQVMIYDFETNETTSPYKAALAMNDVKTPTQGRSEIYQNGDVFVEETDHGRLFRVTSDGEIVWQYVNRTRDGGLYHVTWSRIIRTEDRDKFTNFLKDLNCETQQ